MQRVVVIDPRDLLQLMTHYNDGQDIPLNTELINVGVSPFLQRWVCFMCESGDWPTGAMVPGTDFMSPLHLRYEGNKIMILSAPGDEPIYEEAPDAPRRQ